MGLAPSDLRVGDLPQEGLVFFVRGVTFSPRHQSLEILLQHGPKADPIRQISTQASGNRSNSLAMGLGFGI